jgi:ferredoxin-NADP reductase
MARQEIKTLEVMVSDVISETSDTKTLVLFTANDELSYKPGHFLTIDPHQFSILDRWTRYLEDLKGRREPPRAYSLASAPYETGLAITVKEEHYESGVTPYPPLLSPYLVHGLAPGRRIVITGFTGPYVLPDNIEEQTDHIVHICAGSGIVPSWSIIKHCLRGGLAPRQTLIYGNRTREDVIYRSQLEDLARAFPSRFQVIHCLSREKDVTDLGEQFLRGRVTQDVIERFVPEPQSARFFVCGPAVTRYERQAARNAAEKPAPRFMESTLRALGNLGVTRAQVTRESYG